MFCLLFLTRVSRKTKKLPEKAPLGPRRLETSPRIEVRLSKFSRLGHSVIRFLFSTFL